MTRPVDLDGRVAPRPLLLGMGWYPQQVGGLNRYFRGLYDALAADGVRARAVVVGPAHEVPSRVTIAAAGEDRLVTRLRRYRAAAVASGRGADVVDSHFALYAFAPAVFAGLRRLPLVVHFQGPWADESAASGERSKAKLAAKRIVERAVYRNAREIVVLSTAFKRMLVERYGVLPWRVRVISPGVDVERLTPGSRADAREALGIPADAWVALAVRRLVPRMGLDVLLNAWATVAGGRADRLLLVCGEGPYRTELEGLCDRLGLRRSVRFVGRVNDDELLAYYRAANVSIVPSVALEGFGLVVLESLACGTPVVASDAGGLPEALAPLDESLLVPARDVRALAERLDDAVGCRRPLPGESACRRYAETFSWSRVAAAHRRVYTSAVTGGRGDKLRVVYLDHTAALSGGELGLLRLLGALDDVDAHVILGEDGPLVKRLLRAGISVEVLPYAAPARRLPRESVRFGSLPAASVLQTAAYTARIARRLQRLKPDLVHTNSLKAAFYGGSAGRLAGVPVVWHVRDRITEDYLPASAVRLVRALGHVLPTAIIANSRTTLSTLAGLTPLDTVVATPVVHDPVPLPPAAPRRPGRRVRIGMVGRISPWKGQHVFLEAFASAFSNGTVTATIVGAPLFGEDEYERELRELAARLSIESRVTFAGFRDDVAHELSQLDLLVHASVIPEPFGQVVVEGMAAGLPVVAAAAGGPAEVIDDGVNGVLYPPGDAGALAEIMRALAADAEARRRLGRAARAKAEEFAPEIIAAQVRDVYSEVLAARRRGEQRAC